MLQEWPACLLVVRLWEWALTHWTQSMVSTCCYLLLYEFIATKLCLTLMCRTLYINMNHSFLTKSCGDQHSLLAHSDLGIGGLQFGGQPLSTGINGAGQYGMPMLSYYCLNTWMYIPSCHCSPIRINTSMCSPMSSCMFWLFVSIQSRLW